MEHVPPAVRMRPEHHTMQGGERLHVRRSKSAPSLTLRRRTLLEYMLKAPAVEFSWDDDDWRPQPAAKLYRTASVGNSWGVTSIGRGFDWSAKALPEDAQEAISSETTSTQPTSSSSSIPVVGPPKPMLDIERLNPLGISPMTRSSSTSSLSYNPSRIDTARSSFLSSQPVSVSPMTRSPNLSPKSVSPLSPQITGESTTSRPSISRSSTAPRPRRRSSQQRVSLIAGRLSMVSIDPPPQSPIQSPKLTRFSSQQSFASVMSINGPPDSSEKETFLGGRSISEFVIEGDVGRGAYGLVKRAREMNLDGTMGPPLIIKEVIKSRILADCWKKHPKYGTIPIEIHVMSSLSATSYVLPPRRPWDPRRFKTDVSPEEADAWIEGKVVKGHPNICPLLDFFEDNHYYYLVLPCTTPPVQPEAPSPPSDLFDLVESYPHGLPPASIRSYLGQIADALGFLHSKGIVHRDIKDENVVLGPYDGHCILIDFGSSGIVKKHGWDTFSGTLDYAGPEILRGERYFGKEQDVWAFGVVAFVLLVGECPFNTAAEAQEGLESPFANATIALDERCGDGKEKEGEEPDGGGALGDAAALVRACLSVNLADRPTFEKILESRFLSGSGGWGMEEQ